MANSPSEIIINDNEGNAAKKRNEGFNKSSYPLVFFCDDDILLPKDYLNKLYITLTENEKEGYAYTGYTAIVLSPTHPGKYNYKVETKEFDAKELEANNYISTMSLIRREAFPLFDETLLQYDDYDLYLRMLKNGIIGKAVKENEFMAFYLDEGITSVNNRYSIRKMKEQNGLNKFRNSRNRRRC